MISEGGSYKLMNSEDGADLVGKERAIRQFCFAMETRGLARHLSGNKDYSPGGKEGSSC